MEQTHPSLASAHVIGCTEGFSGVSDMPKACDGAGLSCSPARSPIVPSPSSHNEDLRQLWIKEEGISHEHVESSLDMYSRDDDTISQYPCTPFGVDPGYAGRCRTCDTRESCSSADSGPARNESKGHHGLSLPSPAPSACISTVVKRQSLSPSSLSGYARQRSVSTDTASVGSVCSTESRVYSRSTSVSAMLVPTLHEGQLWGLSSHVVPAESSSHTPTTPTSHPIPSVSTPFVTTEFACPQLDAFPSADVNIDSPSAGTISSPTTAPPRSEVMSEIATLDRSAGVPTDKWDSEGALDIEEEGGGVFTEPEQKEAMGLCMPTLDSPVTAVPSLLLPHPSLSAQSLLTSTTASLANIFNQSTQAATTLRSTYGDLSEVSYDPSFPFIPDGTTRLFKYSSCRIVGAETIKNSFTEYICESRRGNVCSLIERNGQGDSIHFVFSVPKSIHLPYIYIYIMHRGH